MHGWEQHGRGAARRRDAPEWLDETAGRVCSSDLYLYCFETDRTVFAPPPVLDSSLLYAFVTSMAYPIQGGIGELDADCPAAADGAGLQRTFGAFVAPTGASAASRFASSTRSWTRLDGVVVANSDLSGFLAPLSINELGDHVHFDVAFGANSPTASGDDATNCLNWGSGNVGTSAGRSTRSSAPAFSGSPITCSSAHLYCLEIP